MARAATAAVRLLTGEREPVRLATTANITLEGLQTIDGVLTAVGDRVLVKDQTDQTTNGIYTASAGVWYRASDARTARTMQKGTTVYVQLGTANAGRTFVFNSLAPVIGEDAIIILAMPNPFFVEAGVLKPEQFGTIGVNAAGDTAAWVALVAAMADGYRIEAKGEYDIAGSSIHFQNLDNIELDLSGAVFRQQSTYSKVFKFTNCTNVRVRRGTFYGYAQVQIDAGGTPSEYNGASTSYNGVAALFFNLCDTIEVDGVRCFNHAGGDIFGYDTNNVWVHHCYLAGIGSTYIAPVGNGSDFSISFQASTLLDDVIFVHNWHDNIIKNHAFGVQAVLTKAFMFHKNVVGPCPGQHGIYTIECDGLNVQGNIFIQCYQQAVKHQHENYAGKYFGEEWATSTVYALGDEVRYSYDLYECLTAHTSGTFATDLAANKWQISTRMNRKGGIIANNIMDRCGTGVSNISTVNNGTTTFGSDGREAYMNGLIIKDNTIIEPSQDGLKLDRCVNMEVSGNIIRGASRYGMYFLDGSGRIYDNQVLESSSSGIFGTLAFDTQFERNNLQQCGIGGSGDGLYPVFLNPTSASTDIPSQDSTPRVDFMGNRIWFTSGDAASAQLTYFDSRYEVYVTETRTNSAKSFRVNGTLLGEFRNDFATFQSGTQTTNNIPTFTISNGLTDVAFNADTVAVGELADVVRTIVALLASKKLLRISES